MAELFEPAMSPSASPHITPEVISETLADANIDILNDSNNLLNVPTQSRNDVLQIDDSQDELHQMVQSILSMDSDNEAQVVFNNLNGLGYNNITPYTETNGILSDISDRDAGRAQKTPTEVTATKHDSSTVSVKQRKFVTEWRTVVFIRHGKSKWNAAEGSAVGKTVAAAQGLWEYYKHKKQRQSNAKKAAAAAATSSSSSSSSSASASTLTREKTEVDIMDAPLSHEGIMEALNLCTYLRQHTQSTELVAFNSLFERTRAEISAIMHSSDANDEDAALSLRNKLQQLLQQLDEYKIQSLLAQYPPQDDENLRLPQPVPESSSSKKSSASALPTIQDDDDDAKTADSNSTPKDPKTVDKSMKESDATAIDTKTDGVPPPSTTTNAGNDEQRRFSTNSADSDGGTGDMSALPLSPTLTATPSTSNMFLQDFPNTNGNSNGKRYMETIAEPHTAMSAEFLVRLLGGNEEKCGVVVSNLRRAMSTACICLSDRLLRRPYEKVNVLGCLQEIGLNSDTRPLLFTKDSKPTLAKSEHESSLLKDVNMRQLYTDKLSMKYYKGDATDKTPHQRLQEFALWLFAQRKYLHVVAIGHSHWFQSFFKLYLPQNVPEDALPAKVRSAKIRNCGVVAFRIQKRYVPSKTKRHGRHFTFEIAPHSITTLHFGIYSAPMTNHDILLREQQQEQQLQRNHEQSSQSNTQNGYLSESDAEEKSKEKEKEKELISHQEVTQLLNDINQEEQQQSSTDVGDSNNKARSPGLPQSNSTMSNDHTPGILASVHDEEYTLLGGFDDTNNQANRPPVPTQLPPPIPLVAGNGNDNESGKSLVEQVNEKADKQDNKESSSTKKKIMAKSKNLFSSAIQKFNTNVEKAKDKLKDKEKEKEKEDTVEMQISQQQSTDDEG